MNFDTIYKKLEKLFYTYPSPVVDFIEAQTKDPFKILIATILSARSKDTITTKVVTKLFQEIDVYSDFRKFSEDELSKMIYPIGFYKNKAKFLKKFPDILDEKFEGKIPQTIDELIQLPGVGRKTANLVLAIAFKIPAVCVDIHVHRIMNRLGYVQTKNPFETEMALRKKLPEKYWLHFNSYLVAYGQNHCSPRNPKCSTCIIYDECNRIGVETKYKLKEKNLFTP